MLNIYVETDQNSFFPGLFNVEKKKNSKYLKYKSFATYILIYSEVYIILLF